MLLAERIDGGIRILQLPASRVSHDARPGLVGFAQRDRVRMALAGGPPQRFVGHFGNVRAAHDHRHPRGTHRVRHAIGLGDHSRHGADAHQSNIVFTHVLRDAGFVHGLGVPVDQHHFVAGRGQRLQQEHPQMRHEVSRNAIVGAIEQYFHRLILF